MPRLLWQQRQDIGPKPRCGAAMVYLGSAGKTVLWGGHDGESDLDDTWEWDGQDWVQVADTGPSPVEGARIAYDAARNVAVLFLSGWIGTGLSSETWEWDGQGWTQVEDIGPRPNSGTFALGYDSARKVTLLEGGSTYLVRNPASSAAVGTWAWDGSSWTQLADLGPSWRGQSALAYDESRERAVLFGGSEFYANHGETQHDTWEWDGAAWKQAADSGPPGRFGHTMVGTGEATLLFGGLGPGYLRDTWSWDGELWRQRQDIGPGPRYLHAMSWDATRKRAVVFGGYERDSTGDSRILVGDTWESLDR